MIANKEAKNKNHIAYSNMHIAICNSNNTICNSDIDTIPYSDISICGHVVMTDIIRLYQNGLCNVCYHNKNIGR